MSLLNDIHMKCSLKTINLLLVEKNKERFIESQYKEYMADMSYLALGGNHKEECWWKNVLAEINGEVEIKETKCAKDIIAETIASANKANFKKERGNNGKSIRHKRKNNPR